MRLTFNSLPDSHACVKQACMHALYCNFQFPTGFSLSYLLISVYYEPVTLSIPYRILTQPINYTAMQSIILSIPYRILTQYEEEELQECAHSFNSLPDSHSCTSICPSTNSQLSIPYRILTRANSFVGNIIALLSFNSLPDSHLKTCTATYLGRHLSIPYRILTVSRQGGAASTKIANLSIPYRILTC